MKKYPEIKFIIDSNNDMEAYQGFLESLKGHDLRRELEDYFYYPYPRLKQIQNKKIDKQKKTKLISDFIDSIFKKEEPKIKKGVKEVKKLWQQTATLYFKEVDRLFDYYPWPRGKYIGYPTIWGIYPRFIEDKTFSFPYEHKIKNFAIYIIAHEMLHFIFYDYFYKYFPEYKKKKYKDRVWELSEIFNILLEDTPEWQKLTGVKYKGYPNLRPKAMRLKKIWQKEKSTKDFLAKAIKEI